MNPPRPRIVHLITSLETGGAEMMLLKLLAGMRDAPFEQRVVSLTGEGVLAARIRELGVPVEALGMRRGRPDPRGLIALTGRLRRSRPRVLQTWLYHSDLLGLVAGRLAGVPRIAWNVRCSITDERYFRGLGGLVVRLLARLSRWPDVVLVNSEAGLAVHRGLGYRPRRWELIPNGFDLDLFKPDPAARARLRAAWGIAPATPLIGMVGRFDPLKGHDVFIAAAERLAGGRDDVRFALVGDGLSPEYPDLHAGLGERLLLLGRRDDVAAVNNAFDIATSASTGEGFPNVLGEAMACGVPCVATDVGDARAILGETGAIVPPSDPDALAAAWRTLLDEAADARAARGAAARERIAAHYDLNDIVARYRALYGELAAV